MNKLYEEFISAPDEFSPMPFWFWNDAFCDEEIKRQIQDMYDKGVMGFVIHPRIGVPKDIEYMSDKFLGYVRCAVKEAKRLGMKVMLYDEGMYPSGSAHGLVVKENADFASKGLMVIESDSDEIKLNEGESLVVTLIAKKTGDKSVDFDSIEVFAGENVGNKTYFHFIQGFTGGHIRGIHEGEDDWENPPKSADLLNKRAVETFIRITHQGYYDALSEYFNDNTVIAIFTDEPSIMGREGNSRMKPWTDGFLDKFVLGGNKLTDLMALWYNVGDKTDEIKKRYLETVQNALNDSFYKPIHLWCKEHNVALSGHPGESQDIGLLDYFDIPGQDLIFRHVAPEGDSALIGGESTMAKCSSDAARHSGQRRNLNECFACSGKDGIEWSFTADDMKWMSDWLLVRGVNLLVPHAFYYSVDGELRFGERPPDVGPNNIWWKHYKYFSAYVKRMSYMMSDSYNVTDIAILCESDLLPFDAAAVLYKNQIEFNYLKESLLKDNYKGGGYVKIYNQKYSTLILEKASLINDTVIDFARCGGKVIVYNPCGLKISDELISIESFDEILDNVSKDLIITPKNEKLRVSHIVKDNEHFYVMTNEGEDEITGTLSVFADGDIKVLDAWDGTVSEYKGETIRLLRRESLILGVGKNPEERINIKLGKENEEYAVKELNDFTVDNKKAVLGDWTKQNDTKDFCGTIEYRTSISLNKSKKVILDLDKVGEICEVIVNGEDAGFILWAPFELDITEYVKDGENEIKVLVTNSMANHYTKHRIPSGLMGTPKIKILK